MQTKWLSLTIVIILLVLLVAGWLQQPKIAPANETGKVKTYTDPNKVFTISVPEPWSTKTSTASSTIGLNTSLPVQQNIKVTQFSKPAEMGVTIQVIDGIPTCPTNEKANATIGGLPAYYNQAIYTWKLLTTTNTILISAAYPGTNSFHGRDHEKAKTYSDETIANDKKLVMATISSLTFPNIKALDCN